MRASHPDYTAGAESDARWFAKQPHRSHRLRRPIGREADFLGADRERLRGKPVIVTRQLASGIRLRRAMTWIGDLPPNHEQLAHAMFEAAGGALGPMVTAEQLKQKALELMPRGWA